MGIFSKFFNSIRHLFKKNEINQHFYDSLEELLVSADIGVEKSEDIIGNLKHKIAKSKIKDINTAQSFLKEILTESLNFNKTIKFTYPMVICVFGVNGVGKTTTIAKMSNFFLKNKKSVLLAACDTFRAGATEQLCKWADKTGAKIVKQAEGADAGSVVFDAISSAKAKNTDVLIVDTAGRLHTNANLMNELKKIDKIITREYPLAQKINLMVLDASIGQNSLQQVKIFEQNLNIDALAVTKLDGTAKGGVVFQIVESLDIPILFSCFGEKPEDIALFDPQHFVEKILM